MKKVIALFMTALMYFFPSLNLSHIRTDPASWNTNYSFVYVHGLAGWGSYDFMNHVLPYWGMLGGDMIKNLNRLGFHCVSASVDPQGSAWDRACELYAQLSGTRVDYGKAHSERCGHTRFGKDFSKKPLIKSWSGKDKVNLLGHSFGGVTVRMLAELMASGSDEERRVTDPQDLSALFMGGKADWIYSITTLAAPTNGTTAYGFGDPDKELPNRDCAAYDMYIDNALEINKTLHVRDCTYYFAIPCSTTVRAEDGTYVPDKSITEKRMLESAAQMGKATGVTPKGFVVDEAWLENDGSVNTISAGAPFGAPSVQLDKENIQSGVWNVTETFRGDHMSLIGDLFKSRNIRPLYADWMQMINCL
ncbi:MAG: hypothetical protein IJT44_06645 [Clostridia bacterium]|nr:hypothetical protein [Clostridia bacterium]